MSISNIKMRFCTFCGQPSKYDKPTDECAHTYQPPKQILIPCKKLFPDVDWLLYTVDNEIQSVFIDTQEFSGNQKTVGSGGIVLRSPQIIFKSWELKSVDSIIQFLTQEHNIPSNQALEIITVLWHLNDLLIGQSIAWSIEDIYFQENCPKLPLTKNLEFFNLLDSYGDLPISQILNYVYLHGRYEAKNQF